MKPSKQDFLNQYRENIIIGVVQALAKSKAGSQIAFKGGTALKLFYDLPRYSEDVDYDILPGVFDEELLDVITRLFKKQKWEITDQALKYYTLLFELRFAGIERNFRLKIEISTREKQFDTAILSLRGVPVLTLEPSFLMTEKLFTFIERETGRDIFDAWFILNNAYTLNESMIQKTFRDERSFYQTILKRIEKTDPRKISRHTGKLLGPDYRNWIKTSFLADFNMLICRKIEALEVK
jgi:predicted nucleotidyltransferase component of viral defense system